MQLALPPASRVLVVAPHPDDESLGCGGAITRYVRGGTTVALLIVSDGAALAEENDHAESLAVERERETKAAAQILGIKQISFLGLPDGRLDQHSETMVQTIDKHLHDFAPEIVFCPSPIDGHRDHAAVARTLLQLHRRVPGWSLAFYELHTPLRPNYLVDVSAVINVKEQAVLCYKRSLFGKPEFFWSTVKALNQARAFFVHQSGFYEAFWITRLPLTDQEVIDWAIFDFRSQDDASSSLTSIKSMDSLLFAVQEKAREVTSMQRQVENFQQECQNSRQQLQEQAAAIAALQQDLHARTGELQYLKTHFSTWSRQFLRYHLTCWFPVGTLGRRLLQRMNRWRLQYTSKSLKE